ncbi:rod shape-determining protein [bacterium (Candidatus Gribaldobacteria) CG10_big_fil_rev_8_21_14_0_10_37_21]|uniref:Cell shape-determining protein MreB n=1 Tax=bacterium (Candidatus Gribaldobacteria) CG10_big_fil_rev_8_21_14_0_10_37_21 TaxID=2014275 RepID=A0A2H0UUK4_9BACT|nr:MAG: rod shape-determining protein [bacterium (Candidatus Gribaldobacteria) CG10_big_fil_rev_8_21_14_0_10_37_21]
MFNSKLAIDLGTCNCLVFVPKKGIVLNEPSVVAVSKPENKILAVGMEAKSMIGRTPDNIVVYRPLKDGVIADYKVTEAMMRYFIKKSKSKFGFLKPEIVVSIPVGASSTERRAVIEAAKSAGAREAYVAKEPILAAIGAGIPINSAEGNMIIDIGGGTAEIAVVALGGIVTSYSVRAAGDKMDEKIAEFIKKEYNLAIGSQTAEEIKIRVGRALPFKKEETFEVRGRDLIKGLPRNIKISANETAKAVAPVLEKIIEGIKHVLRETPPELSADIMNKGMILSGGGALLRALDQLIAKSTGVPCFVADEPLFCVVKGTGVVLENLDIYKKTIMTKK